jgi:type IX secretion system PorP/SprF family membrane protein
MRRKVSIFIFVLVIFDGYSQQIPQYTQWFWNHLAFNPAFSGIKPCAEIKTLYRSQYRGIDGAPQSGLLTFTTPIHTKKKHYLSPRQGIGGIFERDQIGPFTMNKIRLSYAAHVNFTPDTRLSMGISAGFQQFVFDNSKVTTLFVDPALESSRTVIQPEVSAGLWWNGKNYYVGMALSQLTRSKWTGIGLESSFGIHTILNGGTRIKVDDFFTLLPSAMLRIPPKGPSSLDLNLVMNYKNQFSFGLGFRNVDAVMAFFQIKFNEQLGIGYSFDYVISKLGRNQYFSHEISISYTTCKPDRKGVANCPLF